MEKVINVLSEIEDKASKILDRTKEQKQQLYEQLNKDLAKLENDIKTDTAAKLDVMQKDMDTEIEKERTNLLNDCNKEVATMQENFDTGKSTLVDTIFKKIIEV